jgi:hypothetical protein
MVLYARYREALTNLRSYLQRTDLDATQRNSGLELLATVHIALRDQNAARQALEQLYARDPEHRLSDPDASPPVLSAFGRARSRPPAQIQVELAHEAPSLTERRPPEIEVRVAENADAVAEIRLRYRQSDDAEFTTVVMTVGEAGLATARLPVLDREDAYEVRYYIEATAPSGFVLSTRGSEAEPLTFTMPAAPPQAPIGSGTRDGGGTTASGGEDLWWVWTLLAAALIGGGVVGGYFLVQELSAPDDGDLGTIQLPLFHF